MDVPSRTFHLAIPFLKRRLDENCGQKVQKSRQTFITDREIYGDSRAPIHGHVTFKKVALTDAFHTVSNH